ncbi:hypothetical protein [Pseudomonas avellanae]|uniref:hypothetical protein n=1 Tax=Pseudomonas avellanae TaxID=46257 RepID=UPI001E36BD6E|nr:hypothetical protein [Pseudomonas avellanae]
MVDTQPNSIRKVLYASMLLLYFFIFILSSSSPLLLWLATGSFFVFLGRTLFLIYVNERFSAFATQFYAGRRQKLSATPDQSGTVNLCHIMNSALKNASRSSLASSRA